MTLKTKNSCLRSSLRE